MPSAQVPAGRLPATLPVWSDDPDQPSAGRILGIGRGLAFSGVGDGSIPSIRIGRRILVPTQKLLNMLGESEGPAIAPARAGLQPFAASGAPALPLGGEE